MIYRIAVSKYVNTFEFSHYANEEEMESLRVDNNGNVWKINWIWGCFYGWNDASETHKVEWGVIDYQDDPQHNKLYEGDIIKDGNKNSVIYDIESAIYWIKECTICPSDVIGNIHQNPELLEEK